MGKQKNKRLIPIIYCPICGSKMVAFRREIIEENEPTYWEYGWLCDCTEKIREDFKNRKNDKLA